jgi:hypothetical protein
VLVGNKVSAYIFEIAELSRANRAVFWLRKAKKRELTQRPRLINRKCLVQIGTAQFA